MATVDISIGDAEAMPAGNGGQFNVLEYEVDFAKHPLASGDVLKVFGLPAHVMCVARDIEVTDADSVAGGKIDVGLYKASDDSVIDADSIAAAVAIDATGQVTGPPAASSGTTEPAWVGIARNAGTGTFDDGVLKLRIATIDLS